MRSITLAGSIVLAALAVACGYDATGTGVPNVPSGGAGGDSATSAGGSSVTGTGGDTGDGEGGMGGDSSPSGGSAGAGGNQAPSVGDQALEVAEDGELQIEIDADDPEGDELTFAFDAPDHGSISVDGSKVTYQPDADYHGPDTLLVTVSDGENDVESEVSITVTPVNDDPVAGDDELAGDEDSAATATAAALLGNDADVDGDTLTLTAVGSASVGEVDLDGTIVTFTPPEDFSGTATFEYTVSDGTATDTGVVTVTVGGVNDPPVASDGSEETLENTPVTITLNGADIEGDSLTFAVVDTPEHGSLGTITQASATSATVLYTPDAGYDGQDSFTFTASDGAATSTEATLSITVENVAECGDGLVETPETCDDGELLPDDGCDEDCQVEDGWDCTGEPSDCETFCGDGIPAGSEECDDGPSPETDGCTSECLVAPICAATEPPLADGDRFATDPETGNCYVSFDDDQTTFDDAQAACISAGGHLATITSETEHDLVVSVQNSLQNPWIGLSDELVEGTFTWVTGEPLGFSAFGGDQPDGGDLENCVNLLSGQPGLWNDTSCTFVGFVEGRICELPASSCGDGFLQVVRGEECDDGNVADFDGCSSTCTVEAGASCGGEAPSVCTKLVITEFDYDMPSTDTAEFVEIYNPGGATVNLANHVLVFMNGANNLEYGRIELFGSLGPGGYLLVCPQGAEPGTCAFSVAPGATIANFSVLQNNLQNGPDALGLFRIDGSSATPIDVVSYGAAITGQIADVTGLTSFVEGSPISTGDDMSPNSLQRVPHGSDTQNNATDFSLLPPTPGAPSP